jgi:iron(III) transport system substrate-binding protein
MARPPRGGDTDQIKGVAAGEAEICVSNTYYYVNLMRSKKPEDREVAAKCGVVFPNQSNRGTHVSLSVEPLCDDAEGKKRNGSYWTGARFDGALLDPEFVGLEAAN